MLLLGQFIFYIWMVCHKSDINLFFVSDRLHCLSCCSWFLYVFSKSSTTTNKKYYHAVPCTADLIFYVFPNLQILVANFSKKNWNHNFFIIMIILVKKDWFYLE
jgi:hypothetical protein